MAHQLSCNPVQIFGLTTENELVPALTYSTLSYISIILSLRVRYRQHRVPRAIDLQETEARTDLRRDYPELSANGKQNYTHRA